MVESDIKVYISLLSGNAEVKKRQQRVQMILESKHIDFTIIDITEPTQEKEKDFMQANSTEMGVTVSDTNPRHPLPPQIFNGQQYCGDYNGFELANENDELEAFLKIEVKNGVSAAPVIAPVVPEETKTTDTTTTTIIAEEVAVNGKGDEEKTVDDVQTAEPVAPNEPEPTTETSTEAVAPDDSVQTSEE